MGEAATFMSGVQRLKGFECLKGGAEQVSLSSHPLKSSLSESSPISDIRERRYSGFDRMRVVF